MNKIMPYRKKSSVYTRKSVNTNPKKSYAKKPVMWRRKKSYRKPYVKSNNTVAVKAETTSVYRSYWDTSGIANTKTNSLTNEFQYAANSTNKLDIMFSNAAGENSLGSNFMLRRVSKIIVKLIPEVFDANTVVGTAGEKPKIHWIQDNGETNYYINGTNNAYSTLTVDQARSHPRYRFREFTKPVTFVITPFIYQGRDKLLSYNKYSPTNVNSPSYMADCNPLHFGFTNLPSGFTYKTELTFYITYKDPIVSTL